MRLFAWAVAAAALAACGTAEKRDGSMRDASPLVGEEPIALEAGAARLSLVDVAQEGVLTSPVALVPSPDGRLFVADQVGLVRAIDDDGVQEEPILDLRSALVELDPNLDQRGLLGLALHPDFASNSRIYVFYSAPLREGPPAGFSHTNVLSEFTLTGDPLPTERILLRIDHPQPNNNGGNIAFGPDGMLYLSVGDGGGVGDEGMGHAAVGNGQSRGTLLGKVLRLDVDGGDEMRPYGIPVDNPFAESGGHPLIYAYGFHNPYRFSFDRTTGDLWLADLGEELMEEIDLVEAGGNYGWSVREGFLCFNADDPMDPRPECRDTGPNGEPLLDPITAFVHTPHVDLNGERIDPGAVPATEGYPQLGLAAIGGFVYRGEDLVGHDGTYFFGSLTNDATIPSGKLVAAYEMNGELVLDPVTFDAFPAPGMEVPPTNPDAPAFEAGAIPYYVLGIGEDASGEIYLLANETLGPRSNTGRVFRVVPTPPM